MRRRLIPILFLVLPLITIVVDDAEGASDNTRILLAVDVFDLRLDFDTTLDILGETRFFSSRTNKYAGGRFMVHGGGTPEKTFFIGHFMGVVWGRSSFLMNWENPGLQSFEPLDSTLSTFAFPIGLDVNLKVGGFLTISPYASAKMMWLHLKVEIGDEDFSDTPLKLGFDLGCKVSVKLGGVSIAGGAGLTHILNEDIDFELDDVTFNSRTAGSSPEYFLGVEF